MKPALKSTPVLVSAFAAFVMTAPTSSQAKPAEDSQVSTVRNELAFSQAAAEAIKAKAENANAIRSAFVEGPTGFAQSAGFYRFLGPGKPTVK